MKDDTHNPFGDADMTAEEQALFDQMTKAPAKTPEPESEPTQEASAPAETEEPAEKAEPAKAEDKVEEDRQRDKKGRFVPHQALHAEREEHKKTKAELSSEREGKNLYLDRMDKLLQAFQQTLPNGQVLNGLANGKTEEKKPSVLEQPPVDAEQDFIGAVRQTQEMQRELARVYQQQLTEQQQAQQIEQTRQVFRQSMAEFKAREPAFDDAVMHAMKVQHAVLQSQGVAEEADRVRIIEKQLQDLTQSAISAKRNPAEVLFAIAQSYGWQKQAPAAEPATTPAEQQPSAAAQKIDHVAKAMKAAGGSLSNVGGAGGETISAAQVAAMDEDEFNAFVNRVGERAFAKRFLGAA